LKHKKAGEFNLKAAIIAVCFTVILSGSIKADPEILLEPDTIKIGIIPQSSNFYFTSKAYSTGTDTLRIDTIEVFNECIEVKADKYIIPPGDSAIISVLFRSQKVEGYNIRYPRFKTNARNLGGRTLRLTVIPIIIKDPEVLSPIYVKPFRLIASQYGDSGPREFPFTIYNKSEEYVPLRLIYGDSTYYSLEMPMFVPPLDSTVGYIRLNDIGYGGDFETNITFEFINDNAEPKNYTIPVRRKIFRKNGP
jgi:hypothetical protein